MRLRSLTIFLKNGKVLGFNDVLSFIDTGDTIIFTYYDQNKRFDRDGVFSLNSIAGYVIDKKGDIA